MEQNFAEVQSRHTGICGAGIARVICHIQSTWSFYNSSIRNKFFLKSVTVRSRYQNQERSQSIKMVLLSQLWRKDFVQVRHLLQKLLQLNKMLFVYQAKYASKKLVLLGGCISEALQEDEQVGSWLQSGLLEVTYYPELGIKHRVIYAGSECCGGNHSCSGLIFLWERVLVVLQSSQLSKQEIGSCAQREFIQVCIDHVRACLPLKIYTWFVKYICGSSQFHRAWLVI